MPKTLIGHSSGFCFIHGGVDNEDFSFAIYEGVTLDYYGWGACGAVPDIDVNPIDGAVHTVYVEEFTDDAKRRMIELIEEHKQRYGGCLIECAPYPHNAIADWFASGMPAPELEPEPQPEPKPKVKA